MLAAVLSLLLLVAVGAVIAVRSRRAPVVNVNAAIDPNATPAEAASPQVTPPANVNDAEPPNGRRTQNQQTRRDQSNRGSANNREKRDGKNILERTGDKLKSGARKIKKIFKNPF